MHLHLLCNDEFSSFMAFVLALQCWVFKFMIFWRERMDAAYLVLLQKRKCSLRAGRLAR
jgi:hypothetical protein